MAHKMFQSLHLRMKLPAVKICRNATFSELLETAYGLIIITKLEEGIDPCLFGNSNRFASPVSTREVVESKKSLAFMMRNDFSSFKYIDFSCLGALTS